MSNTPESSEPREEPIVDPSLADGGEVYREYKLALQSESNSSELFLSHEIYLRTILKKSGATLNTIRFEISCPSDVFLFFESMVQSANFADFAKAQGISVSFATFADAIDEILAQKSQGEYSTKLVSTENHHCMLTLQQKLKFKLVDLISIDFASSPDEFVRKQIQYKFDSLQQKLNAVTSERDNLCSMLNIKSPALLSTLVKKQRAAKK